MNLKRVVYYTGQAEGALKNGTRVEKVNSEPGDATPNGGLGTVLGSIGPVDAPEFPGVRYFYFVEWDWAPIPVGVVETKVRPHEG